MLKPNEGRIILNNCDEADSSLILSQIIGYIPQNSFIMDDSIMNNVAIGIEKKDIDIEQVKKSLSRAGLNELLNNLSKHVGESGHFLSGGQKQRLVIARQFYRNNQVLIFDESTNAIDNLTEKQILNEIRNQEKKPLIIIISHSNDLLELCDQVFKIENKKIIKI